MGSSWPWSNINGEGLAYPESPQVPRSGTAEMKEWLADKIRMIIVAKPGKIGTKAFKEIGITEISLKNRRRNG